MSAPFTFDPPAADLLGVLTSTAPVVREARHVRIVGEAVQRCAATTAATTAATAAATTGGNGGADAPEENLHCTFLPPGQFCNYLLALEALNFCFWDCAPRWRVSHQGKTHDGYWALAAALHRAIAQDGAPVADPYWLARIEAFQVRHLLRGEGRPPPLLDARQIHLREVGRVLVERWEGSFANLVASCGGEATTLVRAIAREFSSFDDVAQWRGRPVYFYKRAQICVADLTRLMPEGAATPISGLENLTAFADYKVPQVLRKEGVLEFSPALAETVARRRVVPAGSPEEVEIRAATVWACEWIARSCTPPRTAAQVDHLLWNAGQHKAGLPPYHRTRTGFY